MPTEISVLSRSIAQWLAIPVPIAASLLFGALVAWLCWRSGSTHPVLTRLWRMFMGRTAATDREISRLIETRDRLTRFRFIFGLRARTLAQAKRVAKWSEVHDEELADIKACGRLFNLETCSVVKDEIPNDWVLFANVVFLALLAASALAMFGLMWPDKALLKFHESKTWIWMAPTSASHFNGMPLLAAESCNGPIVPAALGKVGPDEAKALCDAFAKPSNKTFVQDTIEEQRRAFGGLALILSVFATMAWMSLRAGVSARTMLSRQQARQMAAA